MMNMMGNRYDAVLASLNGLIAFSLAFLSTPLSFSSTPHDLNALMKSANVFRKSFDCWVLKLWTS